MTAPARPVPPLTQEEAELLAGLDSVLRSIALRHRSEAIAAGLPFAFLSGLRSRAQQAAEYAKRYDANGKLLPGFTPAAKPGTGKHEVGGAYDLVRQSGAVERKVGEIGERLGLRWGGRFTPTPDPNHFEAPISRLELSTYRNLALVTAAAVMGLVVVVAREG